MGGGTNVVLVVADTTRYDDALTAEVAPNITELGSKGTTFTQAISPAPWTLPSHGSLFTGTYPSKHGAHAGHERLEDRYPTLPELFRSAGYDTAGVSGNTWVSQEGGFARGFDEFHQTWQFVQSETAMGELVEVTEESRVRAVGRKLFDGNPLTNAANAVYRTLVRERGDEGAERATDWIENWVGERDGDDPFFLFANYLEPHLEYRPPKRLAERFLPDGVSYAEAMDVPQEPWEYLAGTLELSDRDLTVLRALYRAEIAYLDEHVGRVRDALKAAGEWDDTVFVLVGDHGENLGEHGLMDHQYCLYDTLLHVPLVASGGAFDGRGEDDRLVSLADVAPTLLDAADVPATTARREFQGQSFHPDADAERHEYVFAEYVQPQPSMEALEEHVDDLPAHVYEYDRSLRAVRSSEFKFVRGSDGSRQLYDVVDDPGETNDLVRQRPERADSMETVLDDWLRSFESADTDADVAIEGDRKAQLEQLGYLQ
ncbi:sulfatase [Halostella sp. PRR32]|uniref:sulfatase n=1 Tax=Halostella sp. PRR32 TaxID=3098147 RepID=UPI002B1E7E20|nr:sulfatase [Halostella sp. PRR32]